MPVDCSQTRHLNPLCGLRNRHAAADAGKELAFSSDWDAVLSDLLFQPFYWPTFSHWITNSANCGRASHTNEKQGTAVLFASQKPGCLLLFQTQPSSSRASPCTARIEQRSSQGKAEAEEFVSILTTCGVMKGTYTLLNPSAPLIWNFIRFCVDRSGYRGNLQRSRLIITAVYIPPQANTDQALKELYRNISEQETAHPDAAFVVTGDFNKANFRTLAPKYFQHVTINTRGARKLDHCYSPFRDAYKSLPRPPFGRSDHSSVLLLPAYRQKLKREAPALRTVHCWSDQSDAILQDCFDHVDWDMFRAASDDDIEAYSDTVTCFIRKCIDDVVPTKTIRIYPNQKPWINSDVRSALSARTSAFKSGNTDDRKQASYDLRRSIKAAKRTLKNKVEEHFNNNNPRSMWQGINNITGFKGIKPATVNIAASLPDELNTFYARFEADNTAHTESAPAAAAEEVSPLTLSVVDVTWSFKRVNIRKAVGPDGIPGRVLKACAFQLAGVFTDIFNLSLSLSVVPSCLKKSIIVPIPKKNKITCLNDWRPVALTPIFSKCFEKLVRDYICSVLPTSLDPLQFAYRSNRSTDDAIAFTLHTALSHLENKNTSVRMLFVDYSSAFNTIVPATLVAKLQTLGLNRSLCSWILDFLTGRSQVVRMGNNTSSPLILNTGAPQGCVLSPLLYSLYTNDCTATHSSNVIVKFADDTTVWNEPQNPQVLLHLHCGEHPDRLHHRLVWKQHRWQPQGSAKGRANCPPHCWRWAFLPPGYLHQAVYKESPEDYQRLQPPIPQTALSVALRATFPQHPIPH